jgi:curved DNA-binding protein CbpA
VTDREQLAGVDLYQVLGVAPEADPAGLARAYRRRLRQLHPDTRAGLDHSTLDHSTAEGTAAAGTVAAGGEPAWDLRAVQHAYQVLRDPARRATYDAARRGRVAEPEHRGSASTGSRRAPATGTAVQIPVRRRHPAAPAPAEPDRFLRHVGPVRIQHRPRQSER